MRNWTKDLPECSEPAAPNSSSGPFPSSSIALHPVPNTSLGCPEPDSWAHRPAKSPLFLQFLSPNLISESHTYTAWPSVATHSPAHTRTSVALDTCRMEPAHMGDTRASQSNKISESYQAFPRMAFHFVKWNTSHRRPGPPLPLT